jgi:hypothetical protein
VLVRTVAKFREGRGFYSPQSSLPLAYPLVLLHMVITICNIWCSGYIWNIIWLDPSARFGLWSYEIVQ